MTSGGHNGKKWNVSGEHHRIVVENTGKKTKAP